MVKAPIRGQDRQRSSDEAGNGMDEKMAGRVIF
jgi:hypothetical protein